MDTFQSRWESIRSRSFVSMHSEIWVPRRWQVGCNGIYSGCHLRIALFYVRSRKSRDRVFRNGICWCPPRSVFDFGRYELSKQLPKIIEGLAERKCWNSGKGNFFTIEVITEDGKAADYDVFFAVSKSSQKGRINLFVQSAYIRDRKTLESSSPIKFRFILYNTLNRIAIKP